MPHSIKHCPGVVLDVALPTAVEHVPWNAEVISGRSGGLSDPADADRVIPALDITRNTSSPSSDVNVSPKVALFQQIVTRASRKARESEIGQRFVSLLAPEVQDTVQASSDIYQKFSKATNDGHKGISLEELRQELSGRFQELL